MNHPPRGKRRLVPGWTWIVVGLAMLHGAGVAGDIPAWPQVTGKARGQTVHWNAWGGDPRINAYIEWVGRELRSRFQVDVRHVKLGDTAEAVARVLAEKAAGRHEQGSVDVLWINGENFASMKRHGLLFGPFADRLPNFRHVDTRGKPTLTDFTLPTEGMEAPWALAQFVFLRDAARVPRPPASIPELLTWAREHPGRFGYPQPPDFLGTTFLKQALLELTPASERATFSRAVDEATFSASTRPLWEYLDALHPWLWRKGRVFPPNGPAQIRHLADGELDIALAFGTEAASSAIENGQLPDTVRVHTSDVGSIGNASFLAIPYNARAREGALVLIDFLLSPEAQARKLDPRHWGSGTVLELDRLEPKDRIWFDHLPRGRASPEGGKDLGPPLAEMHPFWMERLEREWQRRYGASR